MSAWRATVGALVVAFVLTALLVPRAEAANFICNDDDANGYTMCLYPEVTPARPGTRVGVEASGFKKCSHPTVEFDGRDQGALTIEDDFRYRVSGDFVVPSDAVTRKYRVKVVCRGDHAAATRELEVVAPSTPTIRLDPANVAPGGRVSVTGSGFGDCLPASQHGVSQATGDVQISLDGFPATTATLTSDHGFSTPLSVPPALAAGPHTVKAECGTPYGGQASTELQVEIATTGAGGGGGTNPGGGGGDGTGPGGAGIPPGGGSIPGPVYPGPADPGPVYPSPGGPGPAYPSPPSRDTSSGGPPAEVLGGLIALGFAALVVPAVRRLRAPKPAPAAPVTVEAVLAGGRTSTPRLRETGVDRTVALRVEAHVGGSSRTVRWREESR